MIEQIKSPSGKLLFMAKILFTENQITEEQKGSLKSKNIRKLS